MLIYLTFSFPEGNWIAFHLNYKRKCFNFVSPSFLLQRIDGMEQQQISEDIDWEIKDEMSCFAKAKSKGLFINIFIRKAK